MRLIYRLALALAVAVAPAHAADDAAESAKVGVVLDHLHQYASKAQFDDYFALFAPDGVFLGTDATERWTLDQFKNYAKPLAAKHQGWTYTVKQRHVSLAPDSSHAWFDKLLDNATLGECRGTGVLRKVGGEWKIEQYHLTIPVPNALAEDLAKRVRGLP